MLYTAYQLLLIFRKGTTKHHFYKSLGKNFGLIYCKLKSLVIHQLAKTLFSAASKYQFAVPDPPQKRVLQRFQIPFFDKIQSPLDFLPKRLTTINKYLST